MIVVVVRRRRRLGVPAGKKSGPPRAPDYDTAEDENFHQKKKNK